MAWSLNQSRACHGLSQQLILWGTIVSQPGKSHILEGPYLTFSAQQEGSYWGVVGASTLLGLGLLPEFTSAADSVLSTSTPAASWNAIKARRNCRPATGPLH